MWLCVTVWNGGNDREFDFLKNGLSRSLRHGKVSAYGQWPFIGGGNCAVHSLESLLAYGRHIFFSCRATPGKCYTIFKQ